MPNPTVAPSKQAVEKGSRSVSPQMGVTEGPSLLRPWTSIGNAKSVATTDPRKPTCFASSKLRSKVPAHASRYLPVSRSCHWSIRIARSRQPRSMFRLST